MNMESQRKTRGTEHFAMEYLFNNHVAAVDKFEQLVKIDRLPESIIVVCYHRRFVKRTNSLFNEYEPQFMSTPLVFQMPLKPTGRRIYEEVWSMAHTLVKDSSRLFDTKADKPKFWWQQRDWKNMLESKRGEGGLTPFVIKMVDR